MLLLLHNKTCTFLDLLASLPLLSGLLFPLSYHLCSFSYSWGFALEWSLDPIKCSFSLGASSPFRPPWGLLHLLHMDCTKPQQNCCSQILLTWFLLNILWRFGSCPAFRVIWKSVAPFCLFLHMFWYHVDLKVMVCPPPLLITWGLREPW